MGECGEQAASIEQDEQTHAGTDDALLDQRSMRREVVGLPVEAIQLHFGSGVVHARGRPAAAGADTRAGGLHDGRELDASGDAGQTRRAVHDVCRRNRDADARRGLQRARLVGHRLEGLERRHGDGGVTPQALPVERDGGGGDVGDGDDEIHSLSSHEIGEEAPEALSVAIGRGIEHTPPAMAGRPGEEHRLLLTDEDGDAPAAERTCDREGGALVAVGDEGLHARSATSSSTRPASPPLASSTALARRLS
jgi:hypothetical protein